MNSTTRHTHLSPNRCDKQHHYHTEQTLGLQTIMAKCDDCGQVKSCVVIRQSELFLCNECQQIRDIDPPKPGDPPRYLRKDSQKTSSEPASNAKSKQSADSAQAEPPMKCDGPCAIKEGESTCSCFICSKDYHLNCVGLSRRPPKTSNWCCRNCVNFPDVIRKLYHEVRSLTASQQQMELDHSQLKTSHDSLKKENAELRKELNSVKQDLAVLRVDDVTESDDPDPETTIDPSASLVIGDSILRDLNDSTFENTSVQSISGGTMADIFTELEKRDDLNSFANVIIHAGTNDVSRNVNVDETVTSLEAIITHIMVKAPTASVFVSGVCPRTKGHVSEKVEIMNAALKDLAVRLDCQFIDVSTRMTYRDGTIDASQLVDGLHLSARGTETLATLFANSVDGLKIATEPWQEVKRKPQRNHQVSNLDSRTSYRGSRDPFVNTGSRSSYNSSDRRNGNHDHNRRPRQNRQRQNFDRTQKSYTGCYNCGLNNHNQNTCRHKERVRCNKCNRLGHKANYCYSRGSHGTDARRPRY